eukprot:TRINITY_DN6958_c0_g2_i1.p1 TRINITY_DN6958_c0_g2~~TRINITY_DN6958_c0_g2_i1.p1  ORF type:complete len:909 (+),score=132.10 TRINITY_DN6958_c0_g2_i1:61-2787(+)
MGETKVEQPSFLREFDHVADVYRFISKGKGHSLYYQLFGEQVEGIAREYLHSTTVIKHGADKVPYINVGAKVFPTMAWDLIRTKGNKVEIYEMSGQKHERVMHATPGRLEQFEAKFGSIHSSQDAGCVMAVRYTVNSAGAMQFGCAYVNQTLRILGFSEFSENGSNCTNLEAFMLQVGAREVLVPAVKNPSATDKVVNDTILSSGISLEVSKAKVSASELEDRLKFLLREAHCNAAHDLISSSQLAAQAMTAVLDHTELTSDNTNENQFTVRREDLSKYMKLDLAATRALNLFDDETENVQKSKGSLLSFLDSCSTPMGRRTLKLWLTQPLLNVEEIRRRQDITSVFVDDQLLRDAVVTTVLSKVPDLDRILKRVQRKRSSLDDCLKIGKFVALVPKMITYLEAYAGENKNRIDEYIEKLQEISESFSVLEQLVDQSLVVDENDKEVRINPDFDADLAELRDERAVLSTAMNKEFKKTLQQLGHTDKEIKLENSTQLGHHFRATKKGMPAVEKNKSMRKLESRKDGLKFTSPTLSDINTQWKALTERTRERQSELEYQFKETLASYIEPLDEVAELIAELDVFVSFSIVSTRPAVQAYVKPRVLPSPTGDQPRILSIKQGRHPLVEHQLLLRGEEGFVANDLVLGSESNYLSLITGPNMGGKSTFIRTAGVCVLLAQIGMFVPCEEMTLTVCDAVLARLGAADYMSRGISTFMAEMLETNAIVSNATSNSFVIVDELGRGTSTHDGYGLAWGIAEHLVRSVRCCTLFATHFHELTVMADEIPKVNNLHVKADTSGGELKMVYRVCPGPCSKSYGINVAQITKFPEPVIVAAKRKTEQLESQNIKRQKEDPSDNQNALQANQVDEFLVGWITKFNNTPIAPESKETLKELATEYDNKAKVFPQLLEVMS